jgi:predicted HicB family RNase H-like nuclease
MKSTLLCHKGYHGSIEPSVDEATLKGSVLFVEEKISYEAPTIPELQIAFEAAVDRYLEHCAVNGTRPTRPFKGQFNVRIAPQLHQIAALRAQAEGTSLNSIVVQALQTYLSEQPSSCALAA